MNSYLAKRDKVLFAIVWFGLVFAGKDASAQWQGLCQNGHWESSGYANVCVPDQQPARAPTFQPNFGASPPFDPLNTPVMRELNALSGLVTRDAILPQNIPLSGGLVLMHNTQAPPPAPTNYVDPFTNGPGWSPPAKPQAPVAATTVGPNGLNRNLSDVGTMQMQPAPSQPNNGNTIWPNPDPYNNHCTGSFKC